MLMGYASAELLFFCLFIWVKSRVEVILCGERKPGLLLETPTRYYLVIELKGLLW